jgi:hypothetical protein
MRRDFVTVLAVVALSIGLEAKGTTVRLTLSGPGLSAPVAIVEPAILDQSNVWEGRFIGATLDAAPRVAAQVYTVRFDVQPPEWMRQAPRAMYTVQLARDARSGELLLYLPGRGDAGYALNVTTMLRDTDDGRWHRPSSTWASSVERYLPRAATTPAAHPPRS